MISGETAKQYNLTAIISKNKISQGLKLGSLIKLINNRIIVSELILGFQEQLFSEMLAGDSLPIIS